MVDESITLSVKSDHGTGKVELWVYDKEGESICSCDLGIASARSIGNKLIAAADALDKEETD